jgi:hypothetical protein
MDGSKRVGFFLLVLFFAGSVVLMAARELRDQGMRRGAGNPAGARRLIQQLRGEYIANSNTEYAATESMPQRSRGGILQDKDRATLNSLLKQVAPAPEGE